MQHSVSGVWRWNVLATKPNEPSVNIVPSNPKTDSWHADWKPNGKNACAISPLPKSELERRERQRPRMLSEEEKKKIRSLGSDLHKVWTAPTTTDRDRKELLRALLEEVIVTVDRPERRAHLTLRWRGGTLTELDLSLPRMKPRGLHTDEDTISLLRRLAVHYSGRRHRWHSQSSGTQNGNR